MDQMNAVTSAVSALSLTSKPPTSNGKIAWADGPAKKQGFSLPDNIIYYMARNPKSPELYLKLAKSFKYFFEMFPLLIAKRIIVDKAGKRMCPNSFDECHKKNQKCCINLDLSKVTRSKIWLIDNLNIFLSNDISNLSSILIPKLYECKDAQIGFSSTKVSLEELKLWGTLFQKVAFYKGEVVADTDGSVVTIDSMLKAITCVKEFCYWFDDANPATVTSVTMKNILKLKKLDKLTYFHLMEIPEVVPVKNLSAFIKFHPFLIDKIIDQMDSVTLKPKNGNGKIEWPGGLAKIQSFSLPDNIIYYMAKNPSTPEVYLKLAKSCKYFFEKLPLLIAKRLGEKRRKLCSNNGESECKKMNQKCCANVDLAEITKSKIWLTGELYLTGADDPNLASTLLPKLYECQDAVIRFRFSSMNMEEFKLWGKAFTKFSISDNCKIIATDGSPVMIESMLEAITNVKEFCYLFGRANRAANSETMKNILKLKNLDKLESLFLIDPPETLAVKDLSAFMRAYKDTMIRLDFLFNFDLSDEYKRQLDALIDDIIASAIPKHIIYYYEMNVEKFKIMYENYRD